MGQPAVEQAVQPRDAFAPENKTRIPGGFRLPDQRLDGTRIIFSSAGSHVRQLKPREHLEHGLDSRLVPLERRLQVGLQGVLNAVELLILDLDGIDVSRDAAQIGGELGRQHGQFHAVIGADRRLPRQRLETAQGLGIAALHFRQGQQGDIHQIIAVEIRIQNQVGRVAGVLDHEQHPLEKRVFSLRPRRRPSLLERLPFPLDGRGSNLRPAPLGQAIGGELQVARMAIVDGPQRDERPVDFGLAAGLRFPAGGVAGPDATGRKCVLRNVLQQLRQRPLVGIAEFFEFGKPDILIDAVDDKIQQHGNRQRIGQADEREAAGDRQSFKQLRQGRRSDGVDDGPTWQPGVGTLGRSMILRHKAGTRGLTRNSRRCP